jgi:hypothetical protein
MISLAGVVGLAPPSSPLVASAEAITGALSGAVTEWIVAHELTGPGLAGVLHARRIVEWC